MDEEKISSISTPPPLPIQPYVADDEYISISIGKCQQKFLVNDLLLLSYFEALFSDRWQTQQKRNTNSMENTNIPIIIDDKNNQTLHFSAQELCCIIHIKKYQQIPISFPYQRLHHLSNAIDFFSELSLTIDILLIYFRKCKPALAHKTLKNISFPSVTNTDIIQKSAQKYLKIMTNDIQHMRQKWLEKYQTLPIKYILFDDIIITNIFVRSYNIEWVQHTLQNERSWIIQCGCLDRFLSVWEIVKYRKLYKYHISIFECIEKMSHDIDISVPAHHCVHEHVLIALKQIFIDTMDIVVNFNSHELQSQLQTLPQMKKDSSTNAYLRFNLQQLLKTHFEFIIDNRQKIFDICEMQSMLHISKKMTSIQKFNFLKICLTFHKQCMINIKKRVKNVCNENEEFDENCEQKVNVDENIVKYIQVWKSLLQYLIASDVDYSIRLVDKWFAIFVDDIQWILNTVACVLNTQSSQKLAFAIANYATTDCIVNHSMDGKYFEYLSNVLGLEWRLMDNVNISTVLKSNYIRNNGGSCDSNSLIIVDDEYVDNCGGSENDSNFCNANDCEYGLYIDESESNVADCNLNINISSTSTDV